MLFRSACWISPVIGLIYAQTGLFSPKATDEERRMWEHQGEIIATEMVEDSFARKEVIV